MYRAAYQKGFLTVLYTVGSSPLDNWSTFVKNGYVKRVYDEDIKSLVLEISGSNVSTTYIQCPSDCKKQLGIKLPFLVLLIKNMHKYFCFEIKIIDDQHFMRRFRVSNFQSKTSVKPFCTAMPMGMSPGWNQIQFNLADFTRRAYGSNYLESVSLAVHANVRIRRIYFTDKLYTEAELPNEYRLLGKPKQLKQPQKQFKVAPTARPPSPVREVHAVKTETDAETDADTEKAEIKPMASEPEDTEEPPAQTEPTEEFYYY